MPIFVKNQTLTMPDGTRVTCAIGRGGIDEKQGEGDGISPIGQWPIRMLYIRDDKVNRPACKLAMSSIRPDMGWCDAADHPDYNTEISLPFSKSHEMLYRDDDLYDLIIPLGYNDDPVIAGKGSAIFLHVAREGYKPTEGCIALSKEDLLTLIPQLEPGDFLEITR